MNPFEGIFPVMLTHCAQAAGANAAHSSNRPLREKQNGRVQTQRAR